MQPYLQHVLHTLHCASRPRLLFQNLVSTAPFAESISSMLLRSELPRSRGFETSRQQSDRAISEARLPSHGDEECSLTTREPLQNTAQSRPRPWCCATGLPRRSGDRYDLEPADQNMAQTMHLWQTRQIRCRTRLTARPHML